MTGNSESLAIRVNNAERRLMERRRLVRAHGTEIRNRIHDQMTSPALLVSGASLGFLIGESTQDYVSDPEHPWLKMAVRSMPWMYSLL